MLGFDAVCEQEIMSAMVGVCKGGEERKNCLTTALNEQQSFAGNARCMGYKPKKSDNPYFSTSQRVQAGTRDPRLILSVLEHDLEGKLERSLSSSRTVSAAQDS